MNLRSHTETPVAASQPRPAPPLAEVRRVLNRFRRDDLRTRRSTFLDPVVRERKRRV